MNLHDWIDELADVLDVETEVDEGLLLDLARVAAQNVQKTAAPITTYLLGVAVGAGDANPEQVERLAARAQQLAESWDRPADAKDPDGDPITYQWTADAGSFGASSYRQVRWTAPQQAGKVTVTSCTGSGALRLAAALRGTGSRDPGGSRP